MKKIIAIFLTVVLVLSISVISFAAAKKGDVNSDGKVSAVDALYVLKHIVGTETLDKSQITRADMNNNGKLEATDARKILRVAAGLEEVEEETSNKPTIGGDIGGEEPTVNWGDF